MTGWQTPPDETLHSPSPTASNLSIMRKTFLLMAAVAALGSCTKYEQNGSLFHLRSPEKRILGTWTSVRVQEVGAESDGNVTELFGSNNLQLEMTFRDDATVTVTNLGEDLVYEGDYLFNEDNSVLQLNVVSNKTLGPFFWDADSVDHSSEVEAWVAPLLELDTVFFSAGTYADITESTRPYAIQLMSSYTQWTLTGGTWGGYEVGDDVTLNVMNFVEDFINDGVIESAEDTDGIAQGMEDIYGIFVTFEQVEPLVTGWDDPNLEPLLESEFGIQADLFIGIFANSTMDSQILEWISDNQDLDLTIAYPEETKLLNIYWKILELELDDFQAYQFREYSGEDLYDYSYLLRFEQIAD